MVLIASVPGHCLSFSLCIISICNFGYFEGRNLVLNALVPGHCLPLTLYYLIVRETLFVFSSNKVSRLDIISNSCRHDMDAY